jgi:tetratricopeptide (TPR) repeat protein
MKNKNKAVYRHQAPFCRWLALVSLVAIAACGNLPSSPAPEAASAPPRELRISAVLAGEGIKRLQQNQYEEASRVFNAGLKFSPDDARLHFLNGLAYHLLYLRGDQTMLELAVAGYELALSADPSLYEAALQLGRLEFDAKRFVSSASAFRHAAEIEPQKGDAYLGLAAASYYGRDLEAARAAVDIAVQRLSPNEGARRASAIIHAASGYDERARADLAGYASEAGAQRSVAELGRRVDQWRTWRAANPAIQMAQTSLPPPGTLPGVTVQPGPALPPPPAQAGPSPRQPARATWYDCGAASASLGTTPLPAGAATNADETAMIPALPVPCKDAGLPSMVILDVVIVRTEDNSSTSLGINLLTGLTYVFNRSTQVVDTLTNAAGVDTRNVTITRQRSNGLPTPAGVTYSLNIANSADSRSEILARPSLVALDRQPSTFFSGRILSVGLAGQAGGTSTLVDKPVGVSLSVTPTFVDDDSLLVSVRAARSFFEPIDANGSFVQAMQTSRNSVTANVALKYGQTLILSGLSEQEVERATNGVPVLQDIPLLQYLFRNKTTQNFTRSVLILVTPRKPASDRDVTSRTLSELDTWRDGSHKSLIPKIEAQLKRDYGTASGNLDPVYRHSLQSGLYLQFRSGDIRGDDWSQPTRLSTFLRQLGDVLYY